MRLLRPLGRGVVDSAADPLAFRRAVVLYVVWAVFWGLLLARLAELT